MTPLPTGTVTFLFTDIEGSTPLWEQMPREMQSAVAQHHSLLRSCIEARGGQVFQILGDAFQAAFALAGDALQAAIDAQHALQSAQWGPTGALRVRMGLHTGPAEIEQREGPWQGEYAVSHTLNRSARVMSAGQGGHILLTREAADLVIRGLPDGVTLRDLGEQRLKGMQWPEHIFQALVPGLRQDYPLLAAEVIHPHNLPLERTSFIGREKELAQVIELVGRERLVTLTGAGGTGKTRLALRAAGELLPQFPNGVFLVELAAITDPELVPNACAHALKMYIEPGTSVQGALVQYLEKKRLLLVLDNCEHVTAASTALVDALLAACPQLRILATSREILSVPGEVGFRVPSLSVPDLRATITPEALAQVEAVRLFVERSVLPGLTTANARAVAEICRRLDGIPLAIELAAARARVMAPEQIAARLDNVFRLLTGGSRAVLPRQQTLKAMIDWSYNLLDARERMLLQRLSVFSGGWTLEAAEQVCADEETDGDQAIDAFDVIDLLTALVDKSLVGVDAQDGRPRYRMLETIRQYAADRLVESGSGLAWRDRHLDYFTALAEEAEPHLRAAGQIQWMDRLEAEIDNLRSAMEWSRGERIEQGLRLAKAMHWFWWVRDIYTEESLSWLEGLLQAESWLRGDQPPEPERALVRASALNVAADLSNKWNASWALDRYRTMVEESLRLLEPLGPAAKIELAFAHRLSSEFSMEPVSTLLESLAVFRAANQRAFVSLCLWDLAYAYDMIGDREQARVYLEESMAICREDGDYYGICQRTEMMATNEKFQGNLDAAERLYQEAIGYAHTCRSHQLEHWIIMRLGLNLLVEGKHDGANELFEQALHFYQESNQKLPISIALWCLSLIAWNLGDWERAEAIENEAGLLLPEGHPYHNFFYRHFARIALSKGDLESARSHLRNGFQYIPETLSALELLCTYIEILALIITCEGVYRDAVVMFGFVHAKISWRKFSRTVRERAEYEAAVAAARAALGEEEYERAFDEGRSLSHVEGRRLLQELLFVS